ncbi:hypothetical protein KXV85_005371, partial [Aspergillus fumigatus]
MLAPPTQPPAHRLRASPDLDERSKRSASRARGRSCAAPEPASTAARERVRVGIKSSRKTSRARRALLVFLAFAYLFVGISHAISCADEVVAVSLASDFNTTSDDGGQDDDGTKKLPVVASHCYVCAPLLTPTMAAVH